MQKWARVCLVLVSITAGLLAFSKAFAASESEFYGTVTKVVDGDTIHFRNTNAREGSATMKIRMQGMDTPETHLETDRGTQSQGYWGDAAAEQLEKLIPVGTPVQVHTTEFDKYGRALGRVYRSERDVNLRMVQLGWASPYFICSGPSCNRSFMEREKVAEYMQACDEAREAGRGIYDPARPLKEMPFEFRMRMQHRKPSRWVGDIDTHRLYAPADYDRVDLCRRVFFDKRDAAERLGFKLR